MKTRLLIVVFFIFASNSINIIYGLNENIDSDIDSTDESNSQRLMTVTLTNETQILKESPVTPYEKICPEDTDWPDAPNLCDRRENYTRTQLKDLYDEYYQYKGVQWMEMKKTEMDSVIASGLWNGESSQLWHWLGHAQREIPFENTNVYLYYFLNGQAPDVGWRWYAANDEFEPVITLYYISPGAIMIIGSSIIVGVIICAFLSFKGLFLRPKRKTFTVMGFVLVIAGVSMYSFGVFEIIQSQINQSDEEKLPLYILHAMSIFLGIPIALTGIPVILYGVMRRFSIKLTLLSSSGLIVSWVIFIISRFD